MVAAVKSKVQASTTFRVVSGARLAKRDAEVVGNELLRLHRTGALTKERLLEEAKDRGSPLHRFFEWDNKKAAHQYRLEQAAYLLRSIDVVVTDAKGTETSLRAFYHVNTEAGGTRWEPMAVTFSTPDLAEQVLRDAYAQLEGWIARYKRYEWAADAVPVAQKALTKLRRGAGRSRSRRNG